MTDKNKKIVLPGGAGLVGQNLVARLKAARLHQYRRDRQAPRQPGGAAQVQPDIAAEYGDLAEPGEWQRHFAGADVVVMLQAQIGGIDYQEFVRNNVDRQRA